MRRLAGHRVLLYVACDPRERGVLVVFGGGSIKMAKPSVFLERYGPWAVVAGASEGLGAAFAEELARRGLGVVLLARRAEKLVSLAQELEARHGVETRVHALDLADPDAVAAFPAKVAELTLGLLVYNAAFAPLGDFLSLPLEQALQAVEVNIRSPLSLVHALAPRLVAQERGGIVWMSSLAGLQGAPRLAAYAATKAFGAVLAESLWGELRPHGVDVLCSCAGAIRTPNYVAREGGKEAPGILDASAVASRTLDALGRGPRVVPGFVNQVAEMLVGRLLPRATAVNIMKRNTETLE